jgi:DNA-binding NtrC family response regulator
LMVDVLSEEGHQAESVPNSKEGLTLISRHSYDLVVCDLRMPQIDGQAFYEALVSSGSPMSDRVIIVTGDVMAARTRDFLERTRLPYLAKPFLVEELKLAVARVLHSASRPHETSAGRTELEPHTEAHSKS